jgi:dTDP-4-amino-4,6-dideoxy-D-galactose acyltransferase
MVTLGEKEKRADIGLIAVNTNYRGKKIGETLVRASQMWSIEQGYKFAQVVTQGSNAAACSLYKKCGYALEKVEFFYHFWL